MKKIFFAVAILYAMTANAKIWRINYNDDTQADFKTIAACQAWNGFTDGDTLYIEPGMHRGSSADNKITRSCVILGPGWSFQSSSNSISETESAIFQNGINYGTALYGSEDIYISGISFTGSNGINSSGGAYSVNTLVIEKCFTTSEIGLNANSATLKNCYVGGNVSVNYSEKTMMGVIANNIILGYVYIWHAPIVSLVIDHNTIISKESGGYSNRSINGMNDKTIFSNNIVINKSGNDYSKADFVGIEQFMNPLYTMYNNVLSFRSSTIEDAEYKGDHTYDAIKTSTNKIDATIENTFTCNLGTGLTDPAVYYYVKSDAVAKTADSKGGECGAFGGDNPYQLYGRPNGIPYLYDINVPSHTTDNQLKISFKVAGNNE